MDPSQPTWPERGLANDRQRFGNGPRIDELSHLPLNLQIRHEGATWLDRTMLGKSEIVPYAGFGGDVRVAWEARKQALANIGYVRDLGGGEFRAPNDLIARLEGAEINRTGKAFAAERGLDWQPSGPGDRVSGRLVGQRSSPAEGSPWSIAVRAFSSFRGTTRSPSALAQQVEGITMPGGGIDWTFGRSRGLGL